MYMLRPILKYLGGLAAFLAVPWLFFEWYQSSVTWEDHAKCIGALLPYSKQSGVSETIAWRVERAIEKASEKGESITVDIVMAKAFEYNFQWMAKLETAEKFQRYIDEVSRDCANKI